MKLTQKRALTLLLLARENVLETEVPSLISILINQVQPNMHVPVLVIVVACQRGFADHNTHYTLQLCINLSTIEYQP